MSYPVPPPEPSAIIYIAKPKKVTLAAAAASEGNSSKHAALPESSPGTSKPLTASEDSSNRAALPESPAAAIEPATASESSSNQFATPAEISPTTIEPATAGESSSNQPATPAEISPATIEPESTAELLGPPVETGQPPEIADPLAAVASGTAKLGFQNPTAAREPANREIPPDSAFTTYYLPPAGSRDARPITAAPVSGNVAQQENSNRAQNQQPENKPSEPVEIPLPEPNPEPAPSGGQQLEIPTPATPPTPPTPQPQPKPAPAPGQRTPPGQRTVPLPVTPGDTIEIKADSQEFDDKQQIVTAIGRVIVRFRQAVIDADRAVVNLITRQVVASGNVSYTRGQQVVRGQRMEFNLGLNAGTVEQASGELFLPAAGSDLTPTLPTDISAGTILEQPLSDRITSQQPVRGVRSPGAATITIGGGGQLTAPQVTGAVNRVRFEADKLELLPDGTRVATNIRITNDPFSPPELEYRARRATIRRISPTAEELVTTQPRLVFDNRVKIPVYPRRQVFDSQQRSGPCLSFGYDGGDRGGLFAECPFEVIPRGPVRLTVTPQFYIQRTIAENGGNPFSPDNFGLKARLRATLGPQTRLDGSAIFLNFDNFPNLAERDFRGNLRLRQAIGTHTLAGEYSYRDRLFNGSLGFQTVHSSLGAVLTSPVIPLGRSGINLSYQTGYQFINADTDRPDLLDPIRENNRIDLGRFQASFALSRGFNLWQGRPLPRTPTQGLRYTRTPVVPFLQLALGVRGVTSYYSSGDSQNSIAGSVGIQGQFGHFSRPYLDYTGFNVTYTQVARDGLSPFLFDRLVDLRVLSFGLVQQIYGGFRVGFQTAVNLESGDTISTNYTLEYSRRSYAIILRFNPERQVGSLTFRISDFNWNGTPEPFSGDVRTVEGGVRLSD